MSEAAIQNDNTTTPATSKGKKPNATTRAAAKKVKKATTAKAKPAKAAKLKPEKKPTEPREDRSGWGTFALRLPVVERDAFHVASGAAGASRFARIVLNAFSNDDVRAFEGAIAEAKKLR